MACRLSIVLFLLLLCIGCKREVEKDTVSQQRPIPHLQKIDSLVEQLVSDQHTVGISYGVQIGKAQPHYKVYGVSDITTKSPVVYHSQFRIASLTKTITAAGILKLVDQGRLSLEDPLTRFFPDFPGGENITIYQLLSHTSGIPNWWEGGMPRDTPEDFPMCKTPHQYIQQMNKTSFFESGSHFYYSNTGYVLLGEIIEKVSRNSYQDLLRSTVFADANMTATEMEYPAKPSSNWAKGYSIKETDGKLSFSEPEYLHAPYTAGGLRSTPKDLIAFLNVIFEGKLLSKELSRKMTNYAKVHGEKPIYESVFFPYGTPPEPPKHMTKNGYGLGFNIMEFYGEPVIWHSGGIAGFNAIMAYIPKNDTKIVILANTENGVVPAFDDIMKTVMAIR